MPKGVFEMDMSIYPEWILKSFEENGKKPRIITAKELDKNILYGTFGVHVNESENDILIRKIPETDGELGSLWGMSGNVGLDETIKFCNEIKGGVYALLKLTPSDNNSEDGTFLKCMYNGEEKVLADYGIEFRGSENQSRALVVEEYCLYEDLVAYPNVAKCYKPASGANWNTIMPLTRVVRSNDVKLDLRSDDKTKNFVAIVLKLKSPYVVQCFDHKK